MKFVTAQATVHMISRCFLLLFLNAVAVHAEPNLTISPRQYAAGAKVNEWAGFTLDTSGSVIVKSAADVRFSAGSRVTLYPGFKIETGGLFKATALLAGEYNPGGYYNGVSHALSLIGGDEQYGQVGQFNAQPLDIAVWNEAGTAPLVNAPVVITVNEGGGWLSSTNTVNAPLSKTLHLLTDATGTVHVYYQHGATDLVTSTIEVVAGSRTFQFTSFSYSTTGPNADTDGDGMTNTVETLLGTTPTQRAQASTALGLTVWTP